MTDIDTALDNAERALDEGRGLRGTGFWPAVEQLRANAVLAVRYADRASAIDRRAFETGVRARLPLGVGITGLGIGTIVGVAALIAASKLDDAGQTIVFLAGFGAILLSTHSLAHYVVGRALGIRFTHVFLGGPPPPRPGVKTDYATYLRATPGARAVMHASGAVVSKIVPFALVPVALGMNVWRGVVWILLAAGVGTILTDVFLSTKVSDWMKVGRELRLR